nr:probable RNA polymerase II transcription factor B subunit 1-1 isoform X1 [Tanacetum cinerariifolium]
MTATNSAAELAAGPGLSKLVTMSKDDWRWCRTIAAPPIEYETILLDQSAKVEFLPSLLTIEKNGVIDAAVVGMLANPKEDYRDYFHSQQVNSTNQEAGNKQMKSRLSTPQAYVSSSVYMFEIGTIGLSDHVVQREVADMVQKHIQIAVSRGSMLRFLQNAHIQAFKNSSATVREGCLHGEASPLEKEASL